MSDRANVPAFPRPVSQDPTGRYSAHDGATLREYLTGQALIGILAVNARNDIATSEQSQLPPATFILDYQLVASHAVAMADLTLIALDDVTHEDAVKRVADLHVLAQESVDSMEKDKQQEQEGENKDPAAAALPEAQGGGQLPPAPTSEAAEGKPAKTDQKSPAKDPAAGAAANNAGKAKA